jgi:cytidine deaminase
MINKEIQKSLINKALEMLRFSYTPYSNFKVGAALLCSDETIFTGCNIENSSYGPSVCAERTAIFKAVSEGHKDFKAIAIVGGKEGKVEDFCPPCGVCRQVMSEFCNSDFKIILYNGKKTKIYTLKDLLPLSFALEK